MKLAVSLALAWMYVLPVSANVSNNLFVSSFSGCQRVDDGYRFDQRNNLSLVSSHLVTPQSTDAGNMIGQPERVYNHAER